MSSLPKEPQEALQPHQEEITTLLLAWRGGDNHALAELMPMVYRQLKVIARHQLRGQNRSDGMQTTALVHEAYLRILDLGRLSWQDRAHFFAMSTRLMRRILVDNARFHTCAKRGSGKIPLPLDDLSPILVEEAKELLELDDALRQLAEHDAQIAHIVELRFFGGLNREEIAEALGISSATANRRWRTARAWLRKYMADETA